MIAAGTTKCTCVNAGTKQCGTSYADSRKAYEADRRNIFRAVDRIQDTEGSYLRAKMESIPPGERYDYGFVGTGESVRHTMILEALNRLKKYLPPNDKMSETSRIANTRAIVKDSLKVARVSVHQYPRLRKGMSPLILSRRAVASLNSVIASLETAHNALVRYCQLADPMNRSHAQAAVQAIATVLREVREHRVAHMRFTSARDFLPDGAGGKRIEHTMELLVGLGEVMQEITPTAYLIRPTSSHAIEAVSANGFNCTKKPVAGGKALVECIGQFPGVVGIFAATGYDIVHVEYSPDNKKRYFFMSETGCLILNAGDNTALAANRSSTKKRFNAFMDAMSWCYSGGKPAPAR